MRFDQPTPAYPGGGDCPADGAAVPDRDGLTPEAKQLSLSRSYLKRCCEVAIEAALALAHAHERGVVHRDVKPENILIDRQGRVHLIDFGVARFFEDGTLTNTGALVGTPMYMSPEQVTGTTRSRPPDRRLLARPGALRAAHAGPPDRRADPRGGPPADRDQGDAPRVVAEPGDPARPGGRAPQGDRQGPRRPLPDGRRLRRRPPALARRQAGRRAPLPLPARPAGDQGRAAGRDHGPRLRPLPGRRLLGGRSLIMHICFSNFIK